MILNETPVRTSRNFNINNIKVKNVTIKDNVKEFKNINVCNDSSKIVISDDVQKDYTLKYGLSEELTCQVENSANVIKKIDINSLVKKTVKIELNFDLESSELIENLEVHANKNSKSVIILKYNSNDEIEFYHNQVLRVIADEDSDLTIIMLVNLNSLSNNFISIENTLKQNSKVEYKIIDLGGKNSIINYYSNVEGENSKSKLNSIYLGSGKEVFDLNYIANIYGEDASVDIEVQGTLNNNSKKNFKGTIDFKKGCKRAKGSENENCLLLSDTAKSLSLPMLLCSEEEVEGSHSSSAGKISKQELFYIMSRGIDEKSAMKLIVKAKFNSILESIKDENLKEEIINLIDEKLDKGEYNE